MVDRMTDPVRSVMTSIVMLSFISLVARVGDPTFLLFNCLCQYTNMLNDLFKHSIDRHVFETLLFKYILFVFKY